MHQVDEYRQQGSPPRLRGAPLRSQKSLALCRITPAPAGSTIPSHGGVIARRDHPRACGEHKADLTQQRLGEGSPPRLRGAHQCLDADFRLAGITPAPAGSTTLRSRARRSMEDHPRACGEHEPCDHMPGRYTGSPPRLRGAPANCEHGAFWQGITPAPAGSTRCQACSKHTPRDHPRACGEHYRNVRMLRYSSGSPPRLRGAQHWVLKNSGMTGITPAPAGST